jgi:hypothetical protein
MYGSSFSPVDVLPDIMDGGRGIVLYIFLNHQDGIALRTIVVAAKHAHRPKS